MKCLTGVGECAYPGYADVWKVESVLGMTKKELKVLDRYQFVRWRTKKSMKNRIFRKPMHDENIVDATSINQERDETRQKNEAHVKITRRSQRIRRKLDLEESSQESEVVTVITQEEGYIPQCVTSSVSNFNWRKKLKNINKIKTYTVLKAEMMKETLPPIQLARKYE